MNAHADVPAAEKQRRIKRVLADARSLAVEYYQLTGKPLGITGEIAEYEAATKLGLQLADVRTPSFDAIGHVTKRRRRYQIKGRAIDPTKKYSGRMSSVRLDGEFDAVLLVLLDKSSLQTVEIWESSKTKVAKKLNLPGSRARNERGQLAISQFKAIARQVWPRGGPT